MSNRKKEIEALRARIAKLEQQQEEEAREKKALEDTNDQILNLLEQAGLSFESFIRFNLKAVRRITTKLDREEAKVAPAPKKTASKKRIVKKGRRKARTKTTIKIPAGQYANIPGEPDKVFEVKDKGPRPKALKAYAEELGLEKFLEQCRLD